jgi:hypothetical protein
MNLKKMIPGLEKNLTKTGFKISKINATKDSASFAVQGLRFEKQFFQILTLTEESPGFAIVEIFVSNLSTTEKWVDIEVSLEVLPGFLMQMLKTAGEELNREVPLKQLEKVSKQIASIEPKLAKSIHELHRTEDALESPKLNGKQRLSLEKKLGKIEGDCFKQEMEISKLAFRYFTNLIDSIEPFFFNALMTVKWSAKR